jgi:hypothetical protein
MRLMQERFNYTPGNTIPQETENHPYLGVWITKELTWNKHIHQITASTSCTLAFIRWNLNIHHQYGTNTPGPTFVTFLDIPSMDKELEIKHEVALFHRSCAVLNFLNI